VGEDEPAARVGETLARPPGRRDQLAADSPGLIQGQEYRDERDLRGVHHAADGIAARRVWSEVHAQCDRCFAKELDRRFQKRIGTDSALEGGGSGIM
jgi:hypothetical protein